MFEDKSIIVSAPASAMLLGEHAVVHGFPAVVCAANYRIELILTPRHDDKIIINSALGHYESHLSNIEIIFPFTFVLTAIQNYVTSLVHGFELEIKSQFSHQVGLGSSAAVTVALVAALRKLINLSENKIEIYQDALRVIHQVQKRGSGADVAASVFGGVLAYQINPLLINELAFIPDLCLFYSGSKTPTAEVLKIVAEKFQHKENELKTIYQAIGFCAEQGITAIKNADWKKLGEVFNAQQLEMQKLGVMNEALHTLINKLKSISQLSGVKISGSGLGDCVVTLGDMQQHELYQDACCIPLTISREGVRIE